MNRIISKLALMLVLIVTQTFSSFGQSKYWGFNYLATLSFSSPTSSAIPLTGATIPDKKNLNAHTIYDFNGDILFSVTTKGIFDRTGTIVRYFEGNLKSAYPFEGYSRAHYLVHSEIEVFPKGDECGHYFVSYWSLNGSGAGTHDHLSLLEVDASNPLSINVNKLPDLVSNSGTSSNLYTARIGSGFSLVSTNVDNMGNRKLYTVCEPEIPTAPFSDFLMKSWQFNADGTYFPLPDVSLDFGGAIPYTFGIGDKSGELCITEASHDGSKIAYTGPYSLNVFDVSSSLVIKYPIPSTFPEPTITGIEYAPNPSNGPGRWYISFTYRSAPGTRSGYIGYFENGVPGIFHNTGGTLLSTFGASELELGADGNLYFASCPTCPMSPSFIIGAHHPIGSPFLYNAFDNPGILYSFSPYLTTPTFSPVGGIQVKQSTNDGFYYYLNNQIDGEDYSKWSPSTVASADINNGTSLTYPPLGCSLSSPFGPLQVIDKSSPLNLNFKDPSGSIIDLSLYEEFSVSWIETDKCGLTTYPTSSLNYTDGWHSGNAYKDLKTYGSGIFGSSASYGHFFGLTIKAKNKCNSEEMQWNALIYIEDSMAECNVDFKYRLFSHNQNVLEIWPFSPNVFSEYKAKWITSGAWTNYDYAYDYMAPVMQTVCMGEFRRGGLFCSKCINICAGTPGGFLPPSTSCGFEFYYDSYSSNQKLLEVGILGAAPGMTYEVNWGDGSGYGTTAITHLYATSGSYNVCIREMMGSTVNCTKCMMVNIDDCAGSGVIPSSFGFKKPNENTITGLGFLENKINIAPNPATNSTNLNLELVSKENVKVAVIDMTGKMMLDVFNGSIEEGAQKLNINTENLASGLYQVQVMIGNRVSTHKLSVVK